MRVLLVSFMISLTATAGAASYDSLENLLETEGVTSNFPTSFYGSNLPLLVDTLAKEETAEAICAIQNRKLITFSTAEIDFPEKGKSWVYRQSTKLFTKESFDYGYLEGAHTRDVLSSVTCGAVVNQCEANTNN